jgi:hypothetical protein
MGWDAFVRSSDLADAVSAAALPAGTEQLALVAALDQRSDNARASRLGMPSVLFEHKGEVLPDELGAGDPAFASGPREQPVVLWIQRDRGRLLPRQCHGSDMTWASRRRHAGSARIQIAVEAQETLHLVVLTGFAHVADRIRSARWGASCPRQGIPTQRFDSHVRTFFQPGDQRATGGIGGRSCLVRSRPISRSII